MRSKAHAFLLRGGYIRGLGNGLYSYLPLGLRVVENLKSILRNAMNDLGGQEVQMPMVNPLSIWEASGRLDLVERELVQFKDRNGRSLVLSPTHEEAAVELLRSSMKSYRDLPVFFYEFQQKFRDEERTRCGLVRTKEFIMKDAYSFHRSYSDLNNFFPKIFAAYSSVFKECGIPFFTAEAGIGYIGGIKSYEFLMAADYGDDVIITCDSCGYAANRDVAVGIKESYAENPASMEKVETSGCITMEALSGCLDLPRRQLGKAMLYRTQTKYVMAVVRGDYEVSEEKLARAVKRPVLRLATETEIRESGLVPYFFSPVNLPSETAEEIELVVDDTVANSSNLVLGANEEERHYVGVNFGRDFEVQTVADISRIGDGDICLQCGEILGEIRAVELGNIFKLGKFYSEAMDLSFDDDNGNKVYPEMGSYGIGVGRLMAATVEANHDERGIVWPPSLAPFKVFLMGIGRSFKVRQVLERLHADYPDTILFDDREESPGVKFQDADLLGLPLRIIVSGRYLQEGRVEFHDRKTGETWLVGMDQISDIIGAWS